MEITDWIIAVATAVIAGYSVALFQAARRGAQETRDLYEAIVVATLLGGPTSVGGLNNAINLFKKAYKGKAQLFGGSWEE